MEKYSKLSSNIEDIQVKNMNNFDFIRQRSTPSYINNSPKPYSFLEKTNSLFGTKYEEGKNFEIKDLGNIMMKDNNLMQKENINLYSNQSGLNNISNNSILNNNITSLKYNTNMTINRIETKINSIENNINQISKGNSRSTFYDYDFKRSSEDKIITKTETENTTQNQNMPKFNSNIDYSISMNKNISTNEKVMDENNKKLNNKGYYFNYKSDESFNRLNEGNLKPLPSNIKMNSLFNDNFKYKTDYEYNNKEMLNMNKIENKEKEINYLNKTEIDFSKTNDIFNKNIELLNMNRINNSNNFKFNEKNNNYYEGYTNEIEKRNELINKNIYNSINKNVENNNINYEQINNSNDSRFNLSSKASQIDNNNITKERKLHIDYNIDNLQRSKSQKYLINNYDIQESNIKQNDINNNNDTKINNINNINNNSLYNTEEKNRIKSYFQLKNNEENIISKNNINLLNNNTPSNKNDQSLSLMADETNKENEILAKANKNIKNLKNYNNINYSASKNFYSSNNFDINNFINSNYRSNTNGNNLTQNDAIDTSNEMTKKNISNNYYSLTQNRSYRNKGNFDFDLPNHIHSFDNSNIFMNNNKKQITSIEDSKSNNENQDNFFSSSQMNIQRSNTIDNGNNDNNRIFNHRCNSCRHKCNLRAIHSSNNLAVKNNFIENEKENNDINLENKNMQNGQNSRINGLIQNFMKKNNNYNKMKTNIFNKNYNTNIGCNGNICEKCSKSKIINMTNNFWKFNNMRICPKCQKLLSNGNFINMK